MRPQQTAKKYSEKEYRKFDADLRNGVENPKFISFISKAVTECDAVVDEVGPMVSEEDAKVFVDTLLKSISKKDYIAACGPKMKSLLGNKADKTCSCIYNQLVNNPMHLVHTVMNNGFEFENDLWVMDFVLDCMPDEMTPETKNYFVEYMNQMGLPKSIAQCTISAVSKEYSLRTLLKMAFTEDKNINTIFKIMGRQCISE